MENEGIVPSRFIGIVFSGKLIYIIPHYINGYIIGKFQYDGTMELPTCGFVGRLFQKGVYPTGLG